ncbi:angiotensin-converting enzyme-like [Lynx pardinus]|uniref:Angiotensin-converting enzyme n=1 Tax=Lynx pardinus TaxID=191816 RepID=A0A485MRB5_LYNPA|nr:angiotensin-converting enzyme-like [Lynx pardinus]
MGTRWTCHGPSLFVLFCYGQLLPWLRTEGDQNLDKFYNETMAKMFLQFYEHTTQIVWNQFMEATWNYVTNITKKNQEEMLHKDSERSQHMPYFGTWARQFKISRFQDPAMKRMLSKLQNIDKAALPQDELGRGGWAGQYNMLLAYMETTYSMAQVCLNEGPCLPLEPDLEEVMATSRDEKELLWAWQGWQDAVGHQLCITFKCYVQLSNRTAKLNGMVRSMELQRHGGLVAVQESDTLEHDLEQLYQELQPLYLNLHTYMCRALHRHYGSELINPLGPIPAHLLRNMWAQFWVNILDLVLPFPKKPFEDITKIMKSQMDHIQYFLQYKNLSVIFRAGDNPAFEEAVGSMVTLSASSHKYLLNRGLLSHQHQDSEEEVNFLMGIALEKIAFIPFAYLMDLFRWKVFDGTIRKDVYNQEWWNLKWGGQLPWTLCPLPPLLWVGLSASSGMSKVEVPGPVPPPIPRTEDYFDPGAKFHISASVPYIRYFISLVLQFQFHDALASGHVGPLHRCDSYNSKIAEKLLEDVLKLGSSKPWPEVLQKITGQTKVSAKALMTYFKPLLNWLVTENVRQGEILGWPDFSCTFEEKDTDKVTFLSLELDADQAKFGQWVLLALSFIMFLVALLLACRLYSLEKRRPHLQPSHSPATVANKAPIRHCGSAWQRHTQPRTPSLSSGLQRKPH